MTLSENEYASKDDSELFQAIKTMKWPLVETLLQERPELAREPDEYGNMPLHSAIGFKCPEKGVELHAILNGRFFVIASLSCVGVVPVFDSGVTIASVYRKRQLSFVEHFCEIPSVRELFFER